MRAFVFHQAETAHKLVSKLNPGLGNKYEKAKMFRDIQAAKNVTAVSGMQYDSQGNTIAKRHVVSLFGRLLGSFPWLARSTALLFAEHYSYLVDCFYPG